MTTSLVPPPERDIPADRLSLIRAAVLRAAPVTDVTSRRRRIHPWLAAAVTVVLAVIAAQLWTIGSEPRFAAPIAPRESSTTVTPSPSRSTEPLVSDQGAATPQQVRRTVARCQGGQGLTSPLAETHLARDTVASGVVVLFTAENGHSYLCSADTGLVVNRTGPNGGLPEADDRYPAVQLTSTGITGDQQANTVRYTTAQAYAVSADVQRVRLRLSVYGTTGAWFEAEVHHGFVIVAAEVTAAVPADPYPGHSHPAPMIKVDDRADDANGHALRIDRRQR